MVRRLPLLPYVLAALILGTGAATHAAGKFDDVRAVLGEPPPGTTTWILVSKPPKKKGKKVKGFPGLQLHATAGVNVTGNLNPTSGAVGTIVEAHEGRCECRHFHGTLFGKRDPDKQRCGWGCVIPFNDAPDSVGFTSEAIMLEERAFNKVQDGDLDGAFQDLEQSKDAITNARSNAPELGEGDWDPGDAEKYDAALQKALNADTAATAQIAAAQGEKNPRRRKEKLDRALDAIEDGLKAKRSALLRVVKELKLAGGDDED